jgi:hypothetical protein
MIFYTNGNGFIQQGSPLHDNQALNVTISQNGSNTQLYQSNIPLEAGATYRLSFAAYSNTGDGMDVVLQQHGAPYDNYGLAKHFSLMTTWALYSVDFACVTPSAVSDGRLMFWFGTSAKSGDQDWFDRVVLEKTGSTSSSWWKNVLHMRFSRISILQLSTTIHYSTASPGKVELKVFNLLEEAATLVKEEQNWSTQRFEAGRTCLAIYLPGLRPWTFRNE